MTHLVGFISSQGPVEAPEVGSGLGVCGSGFSCFCWTMSRISRKEHENNWLTQRSSSTLYKDLIKLFYSSVRSQTIRFIMSDTLTANTLLFVADALATTCHGSNQFTVNQIFVEFLPWPVENKRENIPHLFSDLYLVEFSEPCIPVLTLVT